jgi:hypothetical protein
MYNKITLPMKKLGNQVPIPFILGKVFIKYILEELLEK